MKHACTHAPGCQAGRLVGCVCCARARAPSRSTALGGACGGAARRGAARRPPRAAALRADLSLSLSLWLRWGRSHRARAQLAALVSPRGGRVPVWERGAARVGPRAQSCPGAARTPRRDPDAHEASCTLGVGRRESDGVRCCEEGAFAAGPQKGGGVDRSQVTWTPWRRPRPNLGGVIRLVKWMRHHNRLGMAVGVRTKTLRYVPCCQDVETSKYACSLAFLTDRPPSPVSAHASILRRRGPDDGRPPRGALAAAARAGGSAQAVLHTWRRGQAARDGHSWPQQCNWARRGGAREPPQVGRRGRRCCVDLV